MNSILARSWRAVTLALILTIGPSAHAGAAGQGSPENIELAQTFTATLNAHDVDALVALFSEADPGPTLTADRYAWGKFEIRQWAQRQVAENSWAEPSEYRVTDRGVIWNADLYREDWRALGVDVVRVSNTLWIHDGRIADFTETLADPRDARRLGESWRPGSVVEPAEPLAVVQRFLVARAVGDLSTAASWCVPVLELQDVDGNWFVDRPSATYWLQQLTAKYAVETLTPPRVAGQKVTWTERLTRRSLDAQDPRPTSMTVDVHAVVRGGRIAYLSAPYPPLPLRP